jgi:hypothetical protein
VLFSSLGNGGPHWRSEFKLWQSECNEEWTFISPNKRRTDSALAALRQKPSSSSIRQKSLAAPVKRKLSFATFVQYPACKGYECPISPEDAKIALQAGYDCPQIRKHAGVIISPAISKLKESIDAQVLFGSVESVDLSSASGDSCSPVEPVVQQKDSSKLECDGPPDNDFASMIDDMSFRVWKCSRCLSMAHFRPACTYSVRCRSCF